MRHSPLDVQFLKSQALRYSISVSEFKKKNPSFATLSLSRKHFAFSRSCFATGIRRSLPGQDCYLEYSESEPQNKTAWFLALVIAKFTIDDGLDCNSNGSFFARSYLLSGKTFCTSR